ncbi:diguanylate cyclase, partial [Vibrio cholerae O1]|uniref:diguanylate cyclase n=1 Tax=Vibrio cholerae TaxID=666 RepID=UPI001C113E4E
LGGEEFLVLLVDVNVDTAMRIAKKISERIQKEKFVLPFGHEMHLTASMGLALYDGHPDYTPTLRRVDKALYQAK